MRIIHALFANENGEIYCKRDNIIFQIVPFTCPCLKCKRCVGTNQGHGCECKWDDFDFDHDVPIYDHQAEYERVNSFKTLNKQDKLKKWEEANKIASQLYLKKRIEQGYYD